MSKHPSAPVARKVGRPRVNDAISSEDVRREILVAAARLFSERGYEGTRLNQVANEAGLMSSSIYYYFANKEEILKALGSFTMERSLRLSREALRNCERAAVGVHLVLADHIERATSGPFDTWYQVQLTAPLGRNSDRYHRWRRNLGQLIERGIAQGDFRTIDIEFALHMIVGCIYGAIELRHDTGVSAPQESADVIIRFLGASGAKANAISAASRIQSATS